MSIDVDGGMDKAVGVEHRCRNGGAREGTKRGILVSRQGYVKIKVELDYSMKLRKMRPLLGSERKTSHILFKFL